MSGALVTPSIIFGDAAGVEGYYTPCDSDVRLESISRGYRRISTRTIQLPGQAWGHVPSKSASAVTPIEVVLNFAQPYMGFIQDLTGAIEAAIGGSSAYQPRDLWYSDDSNKTIVSLNAESPGTPTVVEYSGDADHIAAGDYLFYPAGSGGTAEIVVVDVINHTAEALAANLQNSHGAGVNLYKINWCYPDCRLDAITPPRSSTGRGKMILSIVSEGIPLSGSSLP